MLRADKPIDDPIVHHVCSGAEKFNILNVGQIEVLREQPTKLSRVKATSKPERMLLNVWQLITKPGNRLNSVFIAGIFLLFSAICIGIMLPSASISSNSPAPISQIEKPKRETAARNIWSGAKVYFDRDCTKLAGFVMQAKPGAQTPKLSLIDGSEDWFSRDNVKRLYVESSDPAIARQQLIIEGN